VVSVVGALTVMVECLGMRRIGYVMRGYRRGLGPNGFARSFGIRGRERCRWYCL